MHILFWIVRIFLFRQSVWADMRIPPFTTDCLTMGHPWYRQFGYYFTPYPVYPSAAFWLTDYMISANLEAAYAAHEEAGELDGDAAVGPAPLTPDVKQMIADEVRNQLALESQAAQQNAQQQDVDPGSSGIARMLNDAANGHPHVLVVGSALDVVDGSGMECSLSDGDVLVLRDAPPPDATAANLVVLASKGGNECPKSDLVSVALNDLQEMQNHMRETIDQGLQELQTNQAEVDCPWLRHHPRWRRRCIPPWRLRPIPTWQTSFSNRLNRLARLRTT